MPEDRGKAARQFLYTTVYDQCFSPCGKYLAAASNFGDIALYSVSAALSADATEKSKHPVYSFKACKDGGIFTLASTDTFLISAGDGEIQAWRWSDLQSKTAKLAWALSLPRSGVFSNAEVNSIAVDEKLATRRLYAGAGDRKIHVWDMEAGQYLTAMEGHTDYIHKVLIRNEGQECVSASEDGTVRTWDVRCSAETVHCLEPSKHELCSRPLMGKWLRCLALDPEEGWVVCGGGPAMSAWHLRTLSPTTIFHTPAACQNVALFHDEFILSAGTTPVMNQWRLDGSLRTSVPCTPSCVFSLALNTAAPSPSTKVLCISGSSPHVDCCINFGYKAFSFVFNLHKSGTLTH
ncbi:THO complex subunit 6 homolog [Babylonia areolata]|uniref:THO complex subunit 6 homolog n=1 Tax=Babylonia areolata TaxID=304850 RepID=UPI003FD0BAB1